MADGVNEGGDWTSVWSMTRNGTDFREHVRERGWVSGARWAPGGHAIYYLFRSVNSVEVRRARVLENRDPSPALAQRLSAADSFFSMSISKDGGLAFLQGTRHADLWRSDIPSLLSSVEPVPLRQVTEGVRSLAPQFSPDGARLAFTRHDGEFDQIALSSAEGEDVTIAISEKGRANFPVWSADGEGVAYHFDDGLSSAVRVRNLSTGVDRMLVPAPVGTLAWAPGSPIALAGRGGQGLFLVSPITGEKTLAVEEGALVVQPRVSTRGDRIAVGYKAPSENGTGGLAIVSLADRSLRVIAHTEHRWMPLGWSADDSFVYAINPARGTLVAARADGTGVRTMGTVPSVGMTGHALEIGGRLKVVLASANTRSDIWVVDDFDSGRR